MHKLVVLYPQPADPDHFRRYYVDTHLPLAVKMPGILDFRYSFEVGGDTEYFAVFEADFADAGAMGAALSSPEGAAALADIPNYATGGSVAINYPVTPGR
ncbi:ethyl tert-butyl ether degradation protein EthD [Amycolatopsis antarctica]|uniref:Ethyl tert-butyl ether degradation protein EthD n=1 Tax=Amycolatopsis antarctica TaxID=1854586 RepID=A0A263CV05_9PSEU|nr:EthD family reductase [Amycolatopsis antarctica]OZM69944.1 ethyl tert-butyl ether degradation protein EthD [Amycolatopsis antarctica]